MALLTVPSAFLLPRLTRRLPPGAAAQGLPWLGVLVVPPLAVCWGLFLSEAGSGGSSAAIIGLNAFAVAGVAGLCWPLALGLVASDSHRDRDARVMRAFVVSILSLVVLVPVVHWLCNVALSRQPGAYAVQREQQEQAERIAKALRQFRDATGAYPAKLEDLTAARMPTQGLDTSGNPVPILAGQALSMPQLPALPVDPLTGRSDTWVYNPRSPLLVESGGYEVTVITVMGDR